MKNQSKPKTSRFSEATKRLGDLKSKKTKFQEELMSEFLKSNSPLAQITKAINQNEKTN